jgi:hypothetical protein
MIKIPLSLFFDNYLTFVVNTKLAQICSCAVIFMRSSYPSKDVSSDVLKFTKLQTHTINLVIFAGE